MQFLKQIKWRNLLQLSTFKAILYVVSAAGLTISDDWVQWISGFLLALNAGHDALRDEKKE